MLGSLIVYLKDTRIMMFQLSGFYYRPPNGSRVGGIGDESSGGGGGGGGDVQTALVMSHIMAVVLMRLVMMLFMRTAKVVVFGFRVWGS